MRRSLGSIVIASATLVAVGCATAPSEDAASRGAQALYGNLGTDGCTPEETAALGAAHVAGKAIALTDAFDACLRRRVYDSYLPCLDGDDPFAGETRAVQLDKARTIMQSTNAADTRIQCVVSDDFDGQAQIGDYGADEEEMDYARSYLDGALAQGLDEYQLADLAGTIWHEAMHQQGYRHSEDSASDTTRCGYPASQYSRGFNSMPYIADRCMRSAGIAGRTVAWDDAGHGQSFGTGRHRASQGDLGDVGDNAIRRLRLAPGSRLRYCTDEGADGAGSNCNTVDNVTTEYGDLHDVPAAFRNGISFLEIVPLVVGYAQPDFRGTVLQGFAYREHRANAGDLATVGNDAIRSLYVPPGVRVRACMHEGGIGGHGQAPCTTYDQSQPSVASGLSYLDVTPVVTVFTEDRLRGARASFGPGRWTSDDGGLSPLGDNRAASLVVPQGLTARLCTEPSGLGTCLTFTKTALSLPLWLVGTASFLEVTPSLLGTKRLTVTRTSAASLGRVVSQPTGIDCGADCVGDYEARTEMHLTAIHAATVAVDWTGCDRVVGNACYATMSTDRAISVSFHAKVFDPQCNSECIADCRDAGMLLSRCVPSCRTQCTH